MGKIWTHGCCPLVRRPVTEIRLEPFHGTTRCGTRAQSWRHLFEPGTELEHACHSVIWWFALLCFRGSSQPDLSTTAPLLLWLPRLLAFETSLSQVVGWLILRSRFELTIDFEQNKRKKKK
ncbi:hypothetical protein ACMYSQ_012656 [Aspergillus niger]